MMIGSNMIRSTRAPINLNQETVTGMLVWAQLPKRPGEQMGLRFLVSGGNVGNIGVLNNLSKAEKFKVEFDLEIMKRDPGGDENGKIIKWLPKGKITALSASAGTELLVGGDDATEHNLPDSTLPYFLVELCLDPHPTEKSVLKFNFGDDKNDPLEWGNVQE